MDHNFLLDLMTKKKGEKDTLMAGYDPLSRQLMLLENY